MNALAMIAAAACGGIAAACGGTQPAPSTPAVPPASQSAAPPQKSWTDMNHDERLLLMKTGVFPRMQEAFQKLDAKRFADFSCKTCHGEGVKEKTFDMPNPQLPKLDPKGDFKAEMDVHPDVTKFMMTTVVPTVSGILGIPQYDPATKKGFGCHNCHTMER
jgi:hypothetical protein